MAAILSGLIVLNWWLVLITDLFIPFKWCDTLILHTLRTY